MVAMVIKMADKIGLNKKRYGIKAISMNSALVDKEFVLSLHHKLHVHV